VPDSARRLLVSLHFTPVEENTAVANLLGAADVPAIPWLSHPSSVTSYLKRYDDFPRPVVDLSASRVRLWRRQDIVRWHEQRETP
jgi:hypothetical protein